MFTGIVEEIGTVRSILPLDDAAALEVQAERVLEGSGPGDSIAVNGVCLTVVDAGPDWFRADVMRETLQRSSLGALGDGSPVNLERAARMDSRLGGHIVQGHVDGTAEIRAVDRQQHWTVVRLGLPASLARYVVEKGSIAVDGVSLTVAAVGSDFFEVSLIPTTLAETTLGTVVRGGTVNLEVDVLAKYVERLLEARSA